MSTVLSCIVVRHPADGPEDTCVPAHRQWTSLLVGVFIIINNSNNPWPLWLKSTLDILSPPWLEPRWKSQLVQSACCWCTLYKTISFMSHSWCCTGCGNLELGTSLIVSLLWADSERIQWKFAGAGGQEGRGQWKREACAHQSSGVQEESDTSTHGEKSGNVKQLHAQIAALSTALAELEHLSSPAWPS